MNEGWVKLHRAICESAVFADAEVLQLWLYLLCNAAYEEQELLYCGKVIHLKKGELIIGRKLLAKKLHTKEGKIYRALKLLRELGNIDIQTNNKYSVATIVNWAKYQDDTKKANNKTAAEQQESNNGFDEQNINDYGCLHFINNKNEQQNNSYKTNNYKGFENVENKKRTTKQQQDNSKATAEQQQDNTYKEIKEIKEYKEGGEEYACVRAREETPTPPPTLEEIRDFCSERNSSVNPARFYNYNAARNWKGVSDWRLKIEEWESNEYASEDKAKTDKLNAYMSGAASNESRSDVDLDMFDESRRICEV